MCFANKISLNGEQSISYAASYDDTRGTRSISSHALAPCGHIEDIFRDFCLSFAARLSSFLRFSIFFYTFHEFSICMLTPAFVYPLVPISCVNRKCSKNDFVARNIISHYNSIIIVK